MEKEKEEKNNKTKSYSIHSY